MPSSLANAILKHRKSTSPVPASSIAAEDVLRETHTYDPSLDTRLETSVAHFDEPLILTTALETLSVLDESLDATTSVDRNISPTMEVVSSVHFKATEHSSKSKS